MTEYNIFCFSENYNDNKSFQQKRYRVFNKKVDKERYFEIEKTIAKILPAKKLKLTDFWNQVTTNQWKELLDIPEAKDFKKGFEYISEQNININIDEND